MLRSSRRYQPTTFREVSLNCEDGNGNAVFTKEIEFTGHSLEEIKTVRQTPFRLTIVTIFPILGDRGKEIFCLRGVITSCIAERALPTQTLPFNPPGSEAAAYVEASRLKAAPVVYARLINSRATSGMSLWSASPEFQTRADRESWSFFILAVSLALSLLSCASAPDDNSPAVHGAGVVCFPAPVPAASTGSCDELCATRDAACVGAALKDGPLFPPLTCGHPSTSSSTMMCRCCHVGQ